jgi:hypothetical protein
MIHLIILLRIGQKGVNILKKEVLNQYLTQKGFVFAHRILYLEFKSYPNEHLI